MTYRHPCVIPCANMSVHICLVFTQAIAITLSPLFSLSVIPNSLAVNDSKHRSAAKNLAAARKEARTVRYGREKEEGGLPESDFCGGGGGGGGGSATN
jgi:hypothetical protein